MSKKPLNPIELLDGTLIDPRKIVSVGPVDGDPAWLSYHALMDNKKTIEIYEERKYSDVSTYPQMKREEFVKLWLERG